MRSPSKSESALLHGFLLVATLVAGGVIATPAVAQERGSDRDSDRGDSGDRRRGGWGSRWGNRSDGDRDREGRRDESSSRGGSSERESSARQSDDSPGMTPESYAKGLIDKLDKNENKVLDGEELSKLTGPARTADFNKDGFISREEIIASLASPNSKPAGSVSTPATTSSSKESADRAGDSKEESKDGDSDRRDRGRGGFFGFGGGGRGGDSDRNRSEGEAKSTPTSKRVLTWTGGGKPGEEGKKVRRTYRFTTAPERLPSGLPSWFKLQDKNGDGQVAMSEYSRSWTKSTVAKFQGYDLNGDGVVTAKEAAKKE